MPPHRIHAIERNRRALLRAVRAMLALLPEGALSRGLWLIVLGMVRPAESAARRLVALMALHMNVVARPPVAGVRGAGRGKGTRKGRSGGYSFGLVDPRTNPGMPVTIPRGNGPQIRDLSDPLPAARHEPTEKAVDGTRLRARIDALEAALGDLSKLAERLVRRKMEGRMRWPYAMRPGRPPGYRQRWRHPVDEVLADCNGLFWIAVRESEKVPP